MSHPRTEIRAAVKAALVGQTVAGARVFTNRPNPLSQDPTALTGADRDLPAILIYTRSEASEIFDESPRRYRNRAEVVVEAVLEVGPTTQIDDDLDALALRIENLVLVDDTLGGKASDVELVSTSMTIADGGAKLLGAVIMTFEVEHFSYPVTAGELALDDLATLETQYSLDGEQPDPRDRAKTLAEDLNA